MVNSTTTTPLTTTTTTTIESTNMTWTDTLGTDVSSGTWHVLGAGGSGYVVRENEAEEEEEMTVSGIPLRYLWVPYVSLATILVTLMLASFLRYHQKHGHKYQQRRAELWRRFNMEKLLEQINTVGDGTASAVNSLLPPNGALHFSSLHHTEQKPAKHKDKTAHKKPRKPIVFFENSNGSMVDVRCNPADPPRSDQAQPPAKRPQRPPHPPTEPPPRPPSTLPLLPNISPTASSSGSQRQRSPVLWTLTRPSQGQAGSGGGSAVCWTPASFFSSPMEIQPDEIEAEDDEVLLLQEL